MKTLLIALSFILSMQVNLNAQELENALLWEISGNALEQPSYIFGTIHLTCDTSLNENVIKALDSTTLLVLELDMDDPSMQTEMMKGMYMKDGKTIKDLVNVEDYTIISNFIKEQLGVPLDLLGNMKPFFLSAMFYPKLLDCPAKSIESELMKVAHEQKEEVLGLETVKEQMNVFDDIPYEDQASDLLKSAKDNLAYDKELFEKLLEAYKNEDLQEMEEMMKTDINLTTSKHKDKMLDSRNKNWISKIEDFSRQQPTFFGVGAAHLAGENGVISLLRNAGFNVKPVK